MGKQRVNLSDSGLGCMTDAYHAPVDHYSSQAVRVGPSHLELEEDNWLRTRLPRTENHLTTDADDDDNRRVKMLKSQPGCCSPDAV